MSETAPEAPGGGGRILGMPRKTALIVLGVAVAGAAAYILWKRRQSSSASNAVQSSSAAGGYGVDYGGELSTIQSELESLLQAEGTEPAGGGPGGGGTTTTTGGGGGQQQNCPGGFHWDATQGKCVPGTGEQGVPGGGGTTTTGGGGGKPRPGVPTGVHAVKTTPSAVTIAWNRAPNATSYRVRSTYQGKLVGSQQTVNGNSATISGLHPDHTYTMHVAAVGPGGTSAETNGPAVKTSR